MSASRQPPFSARYFDNRSCKPRFQFLTDLAYLAQRSCEEDVPGPSSELPPAPAEPAGAADESAAGAAAEEEDPFPVRAGRSHCRGPPPFFQFQPVDHQRSAILQLRNKVAGFEQHSYRTCNKSNKLQQLASDDDRQQQRKQQYGVSWLCRIFAKKGG